MISIGEGIILKFKFEDNEDFLDAGDLITFMVVEDAGNILPTFKLIFKTRDIKVISYLNEGATIQASFGGKDLATIPINLVCISVVMSRTGYNFFSIAITGIYDALNYLIKPQIRILPNQSAIETLNSVVSEYFTTDFDPTSSEDSQSYIQHNITDKKFAQHLVEQAKFSDSACISGITFDGFFRIRDLKTLASKPYAWKFTKEVKDSAKDICYTGEAVLESSSGILNSISGYGRKIYALNYDSGLSSIESESTTSVFSNSKAPSRKDSVSERMGAIVPISENMDSEFYNTKLRNSMYNTTCSAYKKTVRFIRCFKRVRILDLVMLSETSINNNNSLDYTSGLYVITKVVRTLSAGIFQTTCELCRESLNDARGDIA